MDQIRTSGTPAAYRRQKQIEDCLYEKLQHTPYQSISVSDICRQVGISRKAYYNYYRDKDACLCSIIDRGSVRPPWKSPPGSLMTQPPWKPPH